MANAALITGGSIRIGRSLSMELAGMGYDVAIHYNLSSEEADRTKLDIQKLGVKCEIFKADLSDPSASSALISKVITKFPALKSLLTTLQYLEK